MNNSRESLQQAARELLFRRDARRKLIRFVKYTYPKYQVDPAHTLIAQEVQNAIEIPGSRLIIIAPPQHGKSEIVSVRAPAWALGVDPDAAIILASYGATLAAGKSRQARGIVGSQDYRRVFPDTTLDPSSRAANEWSIQGKRGRVLAVGVGGPITGHGASLGIIDDPIENWEQAHSEAYRRRIWDWYRGTFRTRIWEEGSIILIMTRWHEDDLVGRLLKQNPEAWKVLRLPAVAETQEGRDEVARRMGLPEGDPDPLGREPGDALAPRRYGHNALATIKNDVGSMAWMAEYQGSPRAPEGSTAKREWFQIVDAVPANSKAVRFWDLAATEKSAKSPDPDWTSGARLSRTSKITYIENIVRSRTSPGGILALLRQTAHLDGRETTIVVEREPGASGKIATNQIITELAGFAVRERPARGDKYVRALPFLAQAEVGNVRIVKGPWNQAFLDEVVSFGVGSHDDMVDSVVGGFTELTSGLGWSRGPA